MTSAMKNPRLTGCLARFTHHQGEAVGDEVLVNGQRFTRPLRPYGLVSWGNVILLMGWGWTAARDCSETRKIPALKFGGFGRHD